MVRAKRATGFLIAIQELHFLEMLERVSPILHSEEQTMNQTRREFLEAVGAVSGLALTATAAFPKWLDEQNSPGLRVRKDVAGLNANSPDIQALKTAIGQMKNNLPAADQRQWLKQATIHGTFARGFGACQHGNWFFLPWHRAYIYYFEEIIRTLSGVPQFALPYWDWTRNRSLPDLFWGNGNPLDNPARPTPPGSGRRTGLTPNSTILDPDYNRYVSQTVISRILDIDDFETFGGLAVTQPGQQAGQGRLENGPHNFIHRWVGGDMATGGSPYDPIFWLHHCNVDRLWTEWARRHPNGTPNDAGWLHTSFTDFCDGQGNPANITVERTLNTAGLGYRYDTRDTPIEVTARRGPLEILTDLKTTQKNVADGAITFGMQATSNFSAQVNAIITAPQDERRRTARLRIRGVKRPTDPNVALDVYLNCQKLTPQTPITDPAYVGSCTFFEHGHGEHDSAEGVSFLFNLTPEFARLYGDRPFPADEPLKVSMIARPLFAQQAISPAAEIQEISPTQVSIEVVTPTT